MAACAAQEIKFKSLGLDIAGIVWGDPGRPVILALHGWLDNAASFEPLAPFLTSGYRVVAIDLWGHGRSDHRAKGLGYPILDYVALVESVRRQLGTDRLLLLGHSLGAGVAVLYAGSHPQFCEQLVLVEGFGPLTSTPDQMPHRLFTHCKQLLDTFDENASSRKSRNRLHVYHDVAEAAAVRQRATGLAQAAALLLAARGTKPEQGGYVWSTDPLLKLDSQYRLTEEQVCSFLSSIPCPVGLITADQGFKFSDGPALHKRLEAVPHLSHKEISGTHHVHMENPEAVAAAIMGFLLK